MQIFRSFATLREFEVLLLDNFVVVTYKILQSLPFYDIFKYLQLLFTLKINHAGKKSQSILLTAF